MAQRATKSPDNNRGQRLKELRQWLRLTQDEMAEWIIGEGASRVNISQSENNTRPVPVERLGEVLGVSSDWIIGLSDERWGSQVHAIRNHLSRWLHTMSPDENSSYMHPGNRIAASYQQIQTVSSLVTERYGAAILGISVDQFREILAEETYVTQHQWDRWAEWTGLPTRWLIHGVQPATADKIDALMDYLPVIEEAVRLGISPERLARLMHALT